MPLLQTSGNDTADAYGGGAAAVPNYIEDVFSTYLYTGNGSTQTITNGIDLSTKGGLVWSKQRSTAANHALIDTARGRSSVLFSNLTDFEATSSAGSDISSFGTTGYSLGANNAAVINSSAETYVSWTFRKQPKFFTCLTYSGNSTNRTIAHDLGSVPGCIIIKKTNGVAAWQVYHRSLANTEYLVLNTTAAKATGATRWNSTTATSTTFSLGTDTTVNDIGDTYVAYLFAHNAGGFGLTGTDNVISCGSYVGAGTSSVSVNLGYEPQWLLIKRATTAGQSWFLFDNMRGTPLSGTTPWLKADTSNAETAVSGNYVIPTATGFTVDPAGAYLNGVNTPGDTYIYIAIRRGPMKVPTSGTSVFAPVTYTGDGTTNRAVSIGFPPDFTILKNRGAVYGTIRDRLRGNSVFLVPSSTDSDTFTNDYGFNGPLQNSLYLAETGGAWNTSANTYVIEAFRRAPSFFDEVCYTGTGVARTVTHNLGVAPELMIVKSRSLGTESWTVWNTTIAALNAANFLWLNSTSNIVTNSGRFNSTAPTSSVFTVGSDTSTNGSGSTYVAYLFASCPGVSKVGSYTGTGATQTISCGFTGGARFVLVKRTDTTGDWYVWDTARGMVSGTDPSLLLNSTAAEVNANSIYTTTGGFQIVSTAAGINASGGTYIYLAIA